MRKKDIDRIVGELCHMEWNGKHKEFADFLREKGYGDLSKEQMERVYYRWKYLREDQDNN